MMMVTLISTSQILMATIFFYHNNHDGTFADRTAEAGVQKPWQSFATWFFDYDNDGHPAVSS